jgi:DNA polymerase-3 subunit epsilon
MQIVMKQALKGSSSLSIGQSMELQTLYKMEQRARKTHRQLHGTQ